MGSEIDEMDNLQMYIYLSFTSPMRKGSSHQPPNGRYTTSSAGPVRMGQK